MPRKHVMVSRWWITMVSIWIIVFSIFVILGIRANRHIAQEIQKSRIRSCEASYGSIAEVFQPFAPPPVKEGDKPTQQQKDWAKFNQIIQEKIDSCDQQTKLK